MRSLASETAEQKIGAQDKKKSGFSALFLAIIGSLACGGAVMVARGNGESPLLYGLFSIFILPPVAKRIALRLSRPRLAQLTTIMVGAMLCTATAFWTAHPSPVKVFQHIFGVIPPPSVRDLSAKKQWFDGRIWLASFKISDSDFASLMNTTALKTEPDETTDPNADPEFQSQIAQSQWNLIVGQWGRLAYDFWVQPPETRHFIVFRRSDSDIDPIGVQVYRNLNTGQVWAVRLD